MKKDNKKRVGLWICPVEYEQIKKDCKEYNETNQTDLTVNRYILKILRERERN